MPRFAQVGSTVGAGRPPLAAAPHASLSGVPMLAFPAVRRRWRVLAPSLLLVLALPATASAADPLSAARGFTVFSAGDATVSTNENDGSPASGGDLVLPSSGD